MQSLMLFAAGPAYLWYALPLIVVISLVYSATRHEVAELVWWGALRTGVWITGFMMIVFGLLFMLNLFA